MEIEESKERIFTRDEPKIIIFFKIMLLVIMAMLVAVVTLQVVGRYIFLKTPRWTEELSRLLFVYLIFLGFPITVYEKEDLKVSFVVDKFTKKTQMFVSGITKILAMLFCIFVMYYGHALFAQMYQRAPIMRTLGIKRAYMFGIVPLSFALTFIIYVMRLRSD